MLYRLSLLKVVVETSKTVVYGRFFVARSCRDGSQAAGSLLNRKALVGTRGIEPPFSPLAALTSNEWLALWYTRSRRAFPCNARLSGPPNGDNCLLIDRYNRNDAMQLVGLRSGLPKTHPSVQCRTAILHRARLGIEPARLGNRTPLHTVTAPSLRPVSTEHWRGVSESNRLLLSLRRATVREWLAPYNNPA